MGTVGTLCTIDLRCAPSACVVHHGAQGDLLIRSFTPTPKFHNEHTHVVHKYSIFMFANRHTYQGAQCSSLVVHNVALYRVGGGQDDFAYSLWTFLWCTMQCCQSQCVCGGICGRYVVGTGLYFAPLTCVVHHQPALCTMTHYITWDHQNTSVRRKDYQTHNAGGAPTLGHFHGEALFLFCRSKVLGPTVFYSQQS